jgi:large subunit ribosomal protein L5
MNRFQFYHHNILSRDFLLKSNEMNIMKVPILSKIVLNTSIKNSSRGSSVQDVGKKGSGAKLAIPQDKNRNLSGLIALEMICGQKLKKTRSKKFIAGFKLRKGELIACKVTLRGIRMFSFFEKLVMVVLPKLRDFQGLGNYEKQTKSLGTSPLKGSSRNSLNRGSLQAINSSQYYSFDNHGNISFGLQNFLLFPELENHYELFESLTGFQVTLVTNAKTHKEARLLLSGNQMPF